jgi:hypothetical protein
MAKNNSTLKVEAVGSSEMLTYLPNYMTYYLKLYLYVHCYKNIKFDIFTIIIIIIINTSITLAANY